MLARLFRREDDTVARSQMVHGVDWYAYVSSNVGAVEALTHDAVWACIDTLASSISSTPLDAVRESGSSRLPVSPQPQIVVSPSALVEADAWRYQLAHSMLYDGNAFGQIVAVDAMARPTHIELLDPDIVTERKVVNGVKQAKVNGTVMQCYPHGDLWHVPGKMLRAGSPFALSPVVYANKAIQAGLQAQEFGLRFFTDGGHPASLLYVADEIDDAQAKQIKASFKAATSGSREPAVFGAGIKYEKVSVDPKDSQFIELQQLVNEKVCRFFRVPPTMVYAAISGQAVTYANVSQDDLSYLKHSVDPYFVRIETAMSALLSRPVVTKFNRKAFLRTDAEARHAVYDKRLRNRTTTINEVRALEDEPPFDDPIYDLPGIPGDPAGDDPTAPQEGQE